MMSLLRYDVFELIPSFFDNLEHTDFSSVGTCVPPQSSTENHRLKRRTFSYFSPKSAIAPIDLNAVSAVCFTVVGVAFQIFR